MLLGLSAYNSSSSDEETVKPVQKEKKKISIPKASYHSSDEDEPSAKKPNLGDNPKKSGLFSKLPAPRNTIGGGKQANRPLIPHVFSRKSEAAKITKTTVQKTKTTLENDPDSSDNEDGVDFFSFVEKKEEIPTSEVSSTDPVVSVTATDDTELPAALSTYSQTIKHSEPQVSHEIHTHTNQYNGENFQTPQSSSVEQLPSSNHVPEDSWQHDERFKRLQGKGNRREKIEFIDINADSALEGNKQLLLQQLSEEKNINRQSHSKKNKDAPSQQSRRKHQMSYLIHQAKEREVELKNAWAAGHAARQAARNRYGF